ncbi:MAG: RNA methyltransferase, partial [Ignavibacteriaceae bacterium]|nr:RNA methyltransferase [Ignavibacteriaceae bacterium]
MKKLTHDQISQNRSTLETLHLVNKLPVYVLLDSIRSNYNVGSIFRTSDGAMIEKLYLCGYTPHPPKKEILKTALGAIDSVPWEYAPNPKDVILKLKEQGVRICALELTESSSEYYKLDDSSFPLCLVIGNEITGVSQDVLDLCDTSIEIPQYGIKQSLNVAVAYGIAIFELRKIFDLKNTNG